jgi:hypothetical protein
VAQELEQVRQQAQVVAEIAACLEPPAPPAVTAKPAPPRAAGEPEGVAEPAGAGQARFEELRERLKEEGGEFATHAARMMEDWEGGLFAGTAVGLPEDNLELERWFKLPKRHLRHIHGRAHAGVRLVQEGPTLLPTLNAHEHHPGPFTAADLLPYRAVPLPACQRQALHRRKVMRKARSAKQRPLLLAELELRYKNAL